jgi:adenylate cyclase
MHRDEEATMALLSARRVTIDDLILGQRGRIANTAGDSVLAKFASVLDAVSCAVGNRVRSLKTPTTEFPNR